MPTRIRRIRHHSSRKVDSDHELLICLDKRAPMKPRVCLLSRFNVRGGQAHGRRQALMPARKMSDRCGFLHHNHCNTSNSAHRLWGDGATLLIEREFCYGNWSRPLMSRWVLSRPCAAVLIKGAPGGEPE
jgi:hypothetical protein